MTANGNILSKHFVMLYQFSDRILRLRNRLYMDCFGINEAISMTQITKVSGRSAYHVLTGKNKSHPEVA
jgi:hypothetical protein